jgi:hypothetical protein
VVAAIAAVAEKAREAAIAMGFIFLLFFINTSERNVR